MKTITKKLTCKKCGSEDIYFEIKGTFTGIRKPDSGEIEDLIVDNYKTVGNFCNNCGAKNIIDKCNKNHA